MDTEPNREEMYSRVNRFVQHCMKIGIPNPYTLKNIYRADKRWHRLHKNAVPMLVKFKNKIIDECRDREKINVVSGFPVDDDKDFVF
ncbi:hypothetical protein ACFLRB_01915 [Acidobacteriota bacterium]